MLSFFRLLETYGVVPENIRLIRHGNKEIPVLEVFREDIARFTEYTAWQLPGKFKGAELLAIFAPGRGSTSIFLGLWRVRGCTENSALRASDIRLLSKHKLPTQWQNHSDHYHLEFDDRLSDLSERIIIDWGRSTVSWVQKKDKPVLEIKAPQSIGDFLSYDDVLLGYADIQKLTQHTDSNVTWVNALSTVNGVYLIRDKTTGLQYVGSAYGKGGILGRWKAYALSGHGGNKLLKALDPVNFEFSILEICPSTMSADNVISRESRWKRVLGTKQFGLNEN